MREHLEALFDLLSRELGGLSGKFPPSPCGLSLPWLLETEPGGSAASWWDLWLAESFKLCSMLQLEDLKRIWSFGAPRELLEEFSCLEVFDAPYIQVKGAAVVGFFGLALCFFFLFSFFHVDKPVFNVLQGFTCQEPADICSSVHSEDVKLFAVWGQRAQKVEE